MAVVSAIGAGQMAQAIFQGIVSSGALKAEELGFFDPHPQEALAQKGYAAFDSIQALCQGSQYLLLSVKPQIAPQVLEELKAYFDPRRHLLLSIAAGISEDFLRGYLGAEARLILVMPNTPILVGQGATAMARCAPTTREEFDFAMSLFSGAGMVREIPKDQLNQVIAVSGSTPAYLYLISKIFCDYAARQGIDFDTANTLFAQTMTGAAAMLTQTGMSHQQLMDMVTSPGGTTRAGLDTLEAQGLRQVLESCCDATIRRAYELGR